MSRCFCVKLDYQSEKIGEGKRICNAVKGFSFLSNPLTHQLCSFLTWLFFQPPSSFFSQLCIGNNKKPYYRQQTFKVRQYLPGPGELGASERRVTLLLLTIILTHMVLTLPARVCRNKICIYSPQEFVSTFMIYKIARTFAIVQDSYCVRWHFSSTSECRISEQRRHYQISQCPPSQILSRFFKSSILKKNIRKLRVPNPIKNCFGNFTKKGEMHEGRGA